MSKIDKKSIIIIVLGSLLIWTGWALFRAGKRVPDNGNTIDSLRTEIRGIGEQQQIIIDRIGNVENRLDDSVERIGEISTGIGKTAENIAGIESRLDDSANRLRDDAKQIEDGQRIIDEIRQRNQEDGK